MGLISAESLVSKVVKWTTKIKYDEANSLGYVINNRVP